MSCGIYDDHIFLQRNVTNISGPEAGNHSISKNMRNLKLNSVKFFRVLSVPFWENNVNHAIGLNHANYCPAYLCIAHF